MKNNTDERVLLNRRHIQSDGFQLLIVILFSSAFVQQVFFHAPVSQYAVELVTAIFAGLYVLIRNYQAGLPLKSRTAGRKKRIFGLLAGAFAALLTIYFLQGERNTEFLITFFAGYFTSSIGVMFLIDYLDEKKRRRIEAAMDEEESA